MKTCSLFCSLLVASSPFSLPAQDTPMKSSNPEPHARIHVDPSNGSDAFDGKGDQSAYRTLERARNAARNLPRPWT